MLIELHGLGVWPRVNRELSRDFPSPKVEPDEQVGRFRIHLDVPIKDKKNYSDLQMALNGYELKKALAILKKEVKQFSDASPEAHAWRTIEAALSE